MTEGECIKVHLIYFIFLCLASTCQSSIRVVKSRPIRVRETNVILFLFFGWLVDTKLFGTLGVWLFKETNYDEEDGDDEDEEHLLPSSIKWSIT